MDAPEKKLPAWLWICVAALIFVSINALISMPDQSISKRHMARLKCMSDMRSITLAARTWSGGHSNQMPRTFTELTNELVTPRLLLCPADFRVESLRTQTNAWATFTDSQSSYTIVSPGVPSAATNEVFLRCKVHGHIGYVDSSVIHGPNRLSGH
jgi:hypothetical protein